MTRRHAAKNPPAMPFVAKSADAGACPLGIEDAKQLNGLFRRKAGRSPDGYRRMMGQLLDLYAAKQR